MNRNTFKTIVLVFGLTVFMSIDTNAQSQNKQQKSPPSTSELLKQMDSDEDGQLSEKEVKGPLKDSFDTIDKNEDGYLSEEELDNAPKPKRKSK
ncbi:EF-hand domain-containing protein [Bizionia arctica]|uniref:EF-hand domain-containing protein n=1 Tax=Bizionia arctica TaxID=1495645 RepID=A0A917GW23_9FLAO|nr:EF-hand domain-containing protein [Bizionia arctica]GGG59089.1 hypothetical protein GCM10010976_32310 [Bizionia arctica]